MNTLTQNTLVQNSLEEYLTSVKPNVSPQLISPETWLNIDTVAKALPQAITSFFGFECRLGTHKPTADFLTCTSASEAGREILAGSNNHLINLPDSLIEKPIWSNIRNFCHHWSKKDSPLHEKIRNIWLEFDIDESLNTVPLPSCFFGPENIYSVQSDNYNSYQWVNQEALKLLLGKTISPKVEKQLFNCFNLLPKEAYVFQVGVMLARKSELVRICIRNISVENILNYLTQINWQGDINELKTLLNDISNLVDRIDLDIDVGEFVYPKIGLECYLTQQPSFEPRWNLFLEYLVKLGLCVREKHDALLAYPGYVREKSHPELLPSSLLKLSKFLGSEYERVFFRGLHHIKIVYQPEKPLEAKAYLSVSHSLITPKFVSQWRKQEKLTVSN